MTHETHDHVATQLIITEGLSGDAETADELLERCETKARDIAAGMKTPEAAAMWTRAAETIQEQRRWCAAAGEVP